MQAPAPSEQGSSSSSGVSVSPETSDAHVLATHALLHSCVLYLASQVLNKLSKTSIVLDVINHKHHKMFTDKVGGVLWAGLHVFV